MRRPTGSISTFVTACLLALAGPVPGAAAPDAIRTSQAADPGPCADRYGKPRFMSRFKEGQSGARIVRDAFGTQPSYGEDNLAIAGNGKVLRVTYPRGSTAPSVKRRPLGGAGFYTHGGAGRDIERSCLTYRVRFPENFDFVRGGKLPGLYGGSDPPSGGERPKGDGGFTARMMWRSGGEGELYLYAPNMRPSSRNGGMRLGSGAFRFARGEWTDLEIEAVLNDPGKENGQIYVRANGKLEIAVRDVKFRETERITIDGLMFSTFFGGKSGRFAPKSTQTVDFADFRVYAK